MAMDFSKETLGDSVATWGLTLTNVNDFRAIVIDVRRHEDNGGTP